MYAATQQYCVVRRNKVRTLENATSLMLAMAAQMLAIGVIFAL